MENFVLTKNNDYGNMTKEELIQACIDKDTTIKQVSSQSKEVYNKQDIIELFNCANDKALRMLKLMFQMGYGNKIGKEYYVSKQQQQKFLTDMAGKEVYI